MERRSLLKTLAAVPFIPTEVKAEGVTNGPDTGTLSPATSGEIYREAEGALSGSLCKTLDEAFATIRAFVAERPWSPTLDAERGATIVRVLDNLKRREIGWYCSRWRSDGAGNLILDPNGDRIKEAIRVRIQLTDVAESLKNQHPVVVECMKDEAGRDKIAAFFEFSAEGIFMGCEERRGVEPYNEATAPI